jgi:ABC-type iron transport system FetAB ATPase subunit
MIGEAEEGCVCPAEGVEAKQATRVDALAMLKQHRKADGVLVRRVGNFGGTYKQDASVIHTCTRPNFTLL